MCREGVRVPERSLVSWLLGAASGTPVREVAPKKDQIWQWTGRPAIVTVQRSTVEGQPFPSSEKETGSGDKETHPSTHTPTQAGLWCPLSLNLRLRSSVA